MGDVFKEQLVKKLPSHKDTLIKAGLIGACFFIAAVAFLFVPTFLPIVIGALGFGIYYTFGTLNKEFEYIFTNGDLDIDCICGKSKRKRKFTCDIKDIILMSHVSVNDADVRRELATATIKMDFGSGKKDSDAYNLLAVYQSKRVHIIFEPNNMMFDAIKLYLSPRKLHKKQ